MYEELSCKSVSDKLHCDVKLKSLSNYSKLPICITILEKQIPSIVNEYRL